MAKSARAVSPFWLKVGSKNVFFFGVVFYPFLAPFWKQKWSQNGSKNGSQTRAVEKKRKIAKSLYVSLNINDFKVPLDPKTVQKMTKIRIKILPKIMSEKISKNVSKNGPKMIQKSSKNRPKKLVGPSGTLS